MVITSNPLLSAFESVAKLRTVHAAARELGVTQTAVTKRIRALEESLSTTLFLRSRQGMALTEEGKALLQLCGAGREIEAQFMGKLRGERRQEISLKLTGPKSALVTRIADACLPVYQKYPFLRLHLVSDDRSDLVESLKECRADIAVIPPSQVPAQMDSRLLKPDRYLLVASAKWKGRTTDEILRSERIIDFHEADPTTLRYLRAFKLDDTVQRARLFINENETLIRYIAAGVGFGTLAESIARPFLERGELIAINRGRALEDPLALVWYPRTQMPDYFKDLIRAIK